MKPINRLKNWATQYQVNHSVHLPRIVRPLRLPRHIITHHARYHPGRRAFTVKVKWYATREEWVAVYRKI